MGPHTVSDVGPQITPPRFVKRKTFSARSMPHPIPMIHRLIASGGNHRICTSIIGLYDLGPAPETPKRRRFQTQRQMRGALLRQGIPMIV